MTSTHDDIFGAWKAYVSSQSVNMETMQRKEKLAQCYLTFVSNNDGHVLQVGKESLFAWLKTRNYLKARSYNNELAILKEFLRFLEERYHYSKVDIRALRNKRVRESLPRNIALPQMIQLCTPNETETFSALTRLRDQAIVEFLFSTGVRSVELRSALLGHLSSDMTECIIVTAKGGKNRTVYLGRYAVRALSAYLQRRGVDLKLDARRHLFVSRTGKPLDMGSVTRAVKRVAVRRLGFVVTPHMLRHTFATEMLRATGCLRSVQEMLGHVRLKNTNIYCALNLADHEEAIQRFHPHGQLHESTQESAFNLDIGDDEC